jgi:hypothetical protein
VTSNDTRYDGIVIPAVNVAVFGFISANVTAGALRMLPGETRTVGFTISAGSLSNVTLRSDAVGEGWSFTPESINFAPSDVSTTETITYTAGDVPAASSASIWLAESDDERFDGVQLSLTTTVLASININASEVSLLYNGSDTKTYLRSRRTLNTLANHSYSKNHSARKAGSGNSHLPSPYR